MSTVVDTTTERLERIAAQCRTRYQPFPEPLISAICAYVEGSGSLLQVLREWKAAAMAKRYYAGNFIALSNPMTERLDEMDLRILELCLATKTAGAYLQVFADSPVLEQIHQHMLKLRMSVPKIIKVLMTCHSTIKTTSENQFVPTALGRLLLSYLPEHFEVMLKQLPPQSWSHTTQPFFTLLLTARPEGYLDMAEQVARTAHPNQHDCYAAELLKADPARFTDWAREVAAASLQNTQQYYYYTLEALLKADPARHLDLALAAAKAPLPTNRWIQAKLQCIGLEAAFRFDPVQYLPLVEQAAVASSYYYGLKAVELLKDYDFEQARPVLQRCIASGHPETALKALDVVMQQRWAERQSYAISLLAHPSRRIRAAILPWLWGETFRNETALLVDGILPFLTDKKLYARHFAVLALQQIKDERIPGILTARLDKERAMPVKLAVLYTSGVAEVITPPAATPRTPIETLVAEAEAVLKYVPRAPLSWFDPAQASALRWTTGEPVPPVVVNYLLFRQSRITNAALAEQIRQALPLFERANTGEFALMLWNGWAEHGARSNEAWCLTALCALGDERLIQTLRQNIDGWSKGARGALAAKTVRAMAYIRSDLALAEISHLAERAKNGQVQRAAREAINASAANLGISLDELADRMVPAFGFDERSERVFDYGARQFSARLRFDQTVLLTDAKGKHPKNLPAPKAQDDASKAGIAHASWKLLKKQIPHVMSLQAQRMETAMIAQRAWDVATWQTFFLKHPLLRSLAVSLVWGVADASGYSITFRPLEDGTLTDNEDNPVALPAEGRIRLVHPALIDEQAQAAWLQHLADYEVTPPFSQMNRAVVRLDPAQREARWWEEYKGYLISESMLMTRFRKADWERCSTQYPGYSLWKEVPSAGIEAVQEGTWLAAPGDDGANLALTRLAFVAAGVLKRIYSNYTANDLQTEDARLLPLGSVPAAIFSEAAALLQSAAALGRYDADWQKKLGRRS
jgi:hypothetical protein